MSSMGEKHVRVIKLMNICFGNSGNIRIVCELVKEDFDLEVSLDDCFTKFCEQRPDDKMSWLWIIFKDICREDWNETKKYLRGLLSD